MFNSNLRETWKNTLRLLAFCAACMVLTLGIYYVTRRRVYVMLTWNLTLAVVPLVLSSIILSIKKKHVRLIFALLLVWLLFLPNAFYIVTDLLHLSGFNFYSLSMTMKMKAYGENLGSYVALLTVSTTAALGTISGAMSIVNVRKLIKSKFALVVICALSGLGMYLGRFLRLNSWDVINPLKVYDVVMSNYSPFMLVVSAAFTLYVAGAYLFFAKFLKWD